MKKAEMNLNTWKKDSRRIRELMETVNALSGFRGTTVLGDAVDCLDEVDALLNLWMNEVAGTRAELKYQIDALKREQLVATNTRN